LNGVSHKNPAGHACQRRSRADSPGHAIARASLYSLEITKVADHRAEASAGAGNGLLTKPQVRSGIRFDALSFGRAYFLPLTIRRRAKQQSRVD
jgi:hypothetical protein